MRNCDECRFSEMTETRCRCAHGNRPVFLAPQSWGDVNTGDWGWKLRCADFKASENVVASDVPDPLCDAYLRRARLEWNVAAHKILNPVSA